MAFTQENFDNLLCKIKGCMADLGDSGVKNKTYGDEDLFCHKVLTMKRLSVIKYVLDWEYNARYGDCQVCDCGGKPITDTDILSCPQECLDDDGICKLAEYVNILCERVREIC